MRAPTETEPRGAVTGREVRRLAVGVALLVTTIGCDAFLTEPAPPPVTVEVAFQLTPPVIGGSVEAFQKIRWAAVRFIRPDSSFRDTIFVALPVNGRVRIPVALEVQERVDALGILASLGVGPTPLFEGGGIVRIDPGQPTSAPIAVQPVPAALFAEAPLVLIPNVGESVDIGSAVLFATGDTVTGAEGTWLSEDPATVSVTPDGTATALQLGQTRLEVRYDGLADTVVVATSPVDSVVVLPTTATLAVGETAQLTAVLQDVLGNALVGRTVLWTTLDATVAAVDPTGLVRATGAGTTGIVARSGTAATTVLVTVTAFQARLRRAGREER